MKNTDWDFVDLSLGKKTEHMIIRPALGGGWCKVCICGSRTIAEQVVRAVNTEELHKRMIQRAEGT